MESNMKGEIVSSYKRLIKDCETSIKKGIDVEKNKTLIEEYQKILNQVKRKPNNAYDEIIKEMKRVSEKMNFFKNFKFKSF